MSLQNLVPFKTLLQLPMEDLQRRAEDPNEAIPGYLILSAMKAKGAMQAGVQQPVPPTVKEQVVAQAAPGIGAMMPQQPMQKFSEGSIGGVRSWMDSLPEGAILRKILEHNRKFEQNTALRSAAEKSATIPTEPTGHGAWLGEGYQYSAAPPVTISGRATGIGGPDAKEVAAYKAAKKVQPTGVAAVGPNPTSKYKEFPEYDVTARDLKDIVVPEIPTNAAYGRALGDIDEEMSGIRSAADKDKFAAVMSAIAANATRHGQGWGASAGLTLSAATEAGLGVQKAADKELAGLRGLRRTTDIAAEAEKAAIARKRYEDAIAERGFEVGQAEKKYGAAFQLADASNKLQSAREKLQIDWAEVKAKLAAVGEAAAARRETALFGVAQRMDAQAARNGQDAKEAVYKKYKDQYGPMLMLDTPQAKKLQFDMEREATDAYSESLKQSSRTISQMLKKAGIDIGDDIGSSSNKTYRPTNMPGK